MEINTKFNKNDKVYYYDEYSNNPIKTVSIEGFLISCNCDSDLRGRIDESIGDLKISYRLSEHIPNVNLKLFKTYEEAKEFAKQQLTAKINML